MTIPNRTAFAAANAAAEKVLDEHSFTQRGLSNRLAAALVSAGIDAPERLLFMSEDQISCISGIGKAGMNEISAYRARFVSVGPAPERRSA